MVRLVFGKYSKSLFQLVCLCFFLYVLLYFSVLSLTPEPLHTQYTVHNQQYYFSWQTVLDTQQMCLICWYWNWYICIRSLEKNAPVAIIMYIAHTLNMHNDNSFDCYVLVLSIFLLLFFSSPQFSFILFFILIPLHQLFPNETDKVSSFVYSLRCHLLVIFGVRVVDFLYMLCVPSMDSVFGISFCHCCWCCCFYMEYGCGILVVQQSYSNF